MTKEQLINLIDSYSSRLTAEDILYSVIENMIMQDTSFLIDMFKLITNRAEHCIDNAVYITKLCEERAKWLEADINGAINIDTDVKIGHIKFIKDLCRAFRIGKLNKVFNCSTKVPYESCL